MTDCGEDAAPDGTATVRSSLDAVKYANWSFEYTRVVHYAVLCPEEAQRAARLSTRRHISIVASN